MEITDKILKFGKVKWRDLLPFQNDNLKTMSKENYERLKNSFISNHNIDTLKVWENKDKAYILDGHGRQKAFEQMIKDGIKIPDKLPAVYLDFKNKKECAEAIMIWGSSYQDWSIEGIDEFLHLNELEKEFEKLEKEINIPGFDSKKYKEGYLEDEKDLDEIPAVPKKALSKLGDLFEIERDGRVHRVLCGDCTVEDNYKLLFGDKKANLLMTSPPYWVGKDYETQKSEKEIDGFISKCIECFVLAMKEDESRIIINSGNCMATSLKTENKTRIILLIDKWANGLFSKSWYLRHIRYWIKGGGRFNPEESNG